MKGFISTILIKQLRPRLNCTKRRKPGVISWVFLKKRIEKVFLNQDDFTS
jgi:hypothetical protein